ncbi:MAG: hypothetical protein K2X31_05420 [Sphingopyxis sp.]|nr:hypothetical protein [Sphingopyxis sp.]
MDRLLGCILYALAVLYAFSAWSDPEADNIFPTLILVFALPLLLRVVFPKLAERADREEF